MVHARSILMGCELPEAGARLDVRHNTPQILPVRPAGESIYTLQLVGIELNGENASEQT